MPDPNITLTAIQTHATALGGAVSRHFANAFRCKAGSLVSVLRVLVLASGKAQVAALPWVGGVVLVLAVADACHVAIGRRSAAAYHAFMRKLPLNGGNAMKAEELEAWQRCGGVAICRHVHDHDSAGG